MGHYGNFQECVGQVTRRMKYPVLRQWFEEDTSRMYVCVCVCVCIYIYIYI